MPTWPSPSPTTTSAVKLKRRPPLTTLATRLMVTTRSKKAVFSAPPSRSRRLSRSRRSRPPPVFSPPLVPAPVPPPRRWGPAITRSFSLAGLGWRRDACFWEAPCSQRQAALAGDVGHGRHPAVVAVATPVEDHGLDARCPGTLGHALAHLARLGRLVAVDGAQ